MPLLILLYQKIIIFLKVNQLVLLWLANKNFLARWLGGYRATNQDRPKCLLMDNAQSALQTPLRQLPFENASLQINSTPLGDF